MFRSATVDSDLFSRYFSRCAVITAQGRTHPVSTHFLKDIYESINYRLASDSPAYLRDDTSTKKDGEPIIFPDLPQRRLNEDVIDYDLLEDLVHYIDETHPEGAILVFLLRVSEIHTLFDKLAASYQFGGRSSEWLLPLHSSVASADQKKVFLRPPDNIRKVNLSASSI
ncbi:hypothetical protein CsSME_00001183 [Camellia sinensis var. sinensis]